LCRAGFPALTKRLREGSAPSPPTPLRQNDLIRNDDRTAGGHADTRRPWHDRRPARGKRCSRADVAVGLHGLTWYARRTRLHRWSGHPGLLGCPDKSWRGMPEATLVLPDFHRDVLLVERLTAACRGCRHQQERHPCGAMPQLPHRPHLSLSWPEEGRLGNPIRRWNWEAPRVASRGLAFAGHATLPHGHDGASAQTSTPAAHGENRVKL
jgi:hypothetical protein